MTYQIKRGDQICGVPAFTARKIANCPMSLNWRRIEELAKIPAEQAKLVFENFKEAGFIEPSEDFKGEFQLTPLGMSLANASAKGGFSRSSCDKAYEGLLQRVQILNQDPYRAFYVRKLVLYGSYYWDQKVRYGDVDLSIDLYHRYDSPYHHAVTERSYQKSGKRLDFWGHLFYGETEARTFLRSRSPILAITEYERHEEWLRDKAGADSTEKTPAF